QVRATAADGGTANHSISILVDPDAVPPDPPEPSPEVAEPSPEVAEPPPDVVEDSSFPDPAPDSSPDVPASEDVALTGDVDVAFVDGLVFVDGRAGDTDIADVSGPPIHPSSDGAASGSCGAGRAPVRFIPAAALLLLFLPAALRRRPRFSGIRRDP
ncbi:MAG: hypothetical protein FJ098_11505, partial [Deltaproteobacteria bacterium]|nr:hypothetical protein [Deltaproteobacteria bacterium]